MYLAEAEKEDKELTEAWKGEADSILVFVSFFFLFYPPLSTAKATYRKTGLFSATVAAFIIESYKNLSPNSGDKSVALLGQISQQLAGVPLETLLAAAGNTSFKPTNSAIRVNVLWFLSLVLSLTSALSATLLQQWARRYLELTQHRGAPHKRARIRAYVFDGVKGTNMYRAVEAMPLLLHISVFFFLAGLIDFLFPINDTVAFYILGYISAFISVYAILTVLPNLILNCPYRTPLSGLAWRISQVSALAVLLVARRLGGSLHEALSSLWHRTNRGLAGLRGPEPARWREKLESQIRTRRKRLVDGMRRSVMLCATGAPWKVDAKALHWTLTVLDGDNEIEDFVARMPGFFESSTVPDATSAILALMDVPSDRSDPILGSRIHDLLKTCEPEVSPLPDDARRNRLRVCLKSLWYCGRGYNQPTYSAPLPSYVRKVFAVPEMILQFRSEEDVSVRLIGRCFESLLAKKIARDVIEHPKRHSRAGRGIFVTQGELMCLSTLFDATSKDVMDWIGQRGAIDLANIVSLATSEADLLAADSIPSEALDVLQRTLEILLTKLPHPSVDLSDDLAVKFCKLYSRVDNAWGTIWLRYQLRPIHERLLGMNSAYSSAWSQIHGSAALRQWGAGVAFETGRYVLSDGTVAISENPGVVSNQIDIQPAGYPEPSDDVSLLSHASVASLFGPQTSRMGLSAIMPIEDVEMELIPLAASEQAEGETTAASPEQVQELEDVVEMTAIPGNGRP